MSIPADSSDELGSLAQNARKASLKQARTILFVLTGLFVVFGTIAGLAAGSVAKSQIDKEVRDLNGQVDPEDVKVATEELTLGIQITAGMMVGLGFTFLILGFLVYRIPVGATVTAMVLYVGLILLNAAFDPTTLFQGIIIKVVVLVSLGKAIQAAIAYERENRAASVPELDQV